MAAEGTRVADFRKKYWRSRWSAIGR